jgi:Zn-dependent protease
MIGQLYILPILLFSVIIHEIAHGYMAMKLGDPTARMMGRLTLNPIPHIDLLGSIIVPLLSLLVAGQVFIAWAKPVPVNPMNFSNYKRDDILVSIVGPISNILVALGCSIAVIALGLLTHALPGTTSPLIEEGMTFFLKMFYGGIYLNIVLAVFNLIPVPPLDGSHVLASILPGELAAQYRRIGFVGIFIILFLMRVPAFNSAFNSVIGGLFTPFQSIIDLFL